MDVVVVDDAEAVGAQVAELVLGSGRAGSGARAGRRDRRAHRCRSTGRWPGGARTSQRCGWWRWTSTSGCRPGTRRRSRRTSSARSPFRWASRPSRSWCRRGVAARARAADRGAGRRRPAAARHRPKRPPGLQRAGVAAGLPQQGGDAQRVDAAGQRAVLRRRAGADARADPGARHHPRGAAPRAARHRRGQGGRRRRSAHRPGDAGLPCVRACSGTRRSRWCWTAAAASVLQRRGSVDGSDRERIHHPQL